MPYSKYRVAPKANRTYNGVLYASKAEAERAQELDWMIRAGTIRLWFPQPLFRLGCPENTYRPDFIVVGYGESWRTSVWAEDVKGVETATFRRNKKLWASYGQCDLRILKRKGTGWTTEVILASRAS